MVRAISFKAQAAIAEERRRLDGIIPQYMVGDLVLLDRLEHDGDFLPEKLAPRYLGPYEVLQQDKNDLYVKHIVMRTNHSYHVTRFKAFVGTREAAFDSSSAPSLTPSRRSGPCRLPRWTPWRSCCRRVRGFLVHVRRSTSRRQFRSPDVRTCFPARFTLLRTRDAVGDGGGWSGRGTVPGRMCG